MISEHWLYELRHYNLFLFTSSQRLGFLTFNEQSSVPLIPPDQTPVRLGPYTCYLERPVSTGCTADPI